MFYGAFSFRMVWLNLMNKKALDWFGVEFISLTLYSTGNFFNHDCFPTFPSGGPDVCWKMQSLA